MTESKYKDIIEPNLLLIERWVRNGATEKEIAEKLGIAYSTFRKYKKSSVALSALLKKGKEIVDTEVENTLLKCALGYDVTETTSKRMLDGEMVVVKKVTKHIQPDIGAIVFWLKNRAADKWKDKPIQGMNDEERKAADDRAEELGKALKARIVAGMDDERNDIQ